MKTVIMGNLNAYSVITHPANSAYLIIKKKYTNWQNVTVILVNLIQYICYNILFNFLFYCKCIAIVSSVTPLLICVVLICWNE